MKATVSVTTTMIAGLLLAAPRLVPGETMTEKADQEETWRPAVDAKPLSPEATRGLQWIVTHQHKNGGWSQGEESARMGNSMAGVKDATTVGDTCVSVLALIRSGSTPAEGPYAQNIRRGIEYICREVKQSSADDLYVTETRGTRLQSKLGTYIDTFLASMVLAEVQGKSAEKEAEETVTAALDKVMDKIAKNQREDGSFGGTGWANTLSQSVAAKGINRAVQAGYQVDEQVRERLEKRAGSRYDKTAGEFSADASAGVDLYASSATLSTLQDSDNTNKEKKQELEQTLASAATDSEKQQARDTLDRFKMNEGNLAAAKQAVVGKLDDPDFIAGFGSNGGEEFLSYMNIGESLVVDGGDEWTKWDQQITANLNRIQNQDGSWTGHHCITGRNFCTAAALLVLMTDRAPVPVAAAMDRR